MRILAFALVGAFCTALLLPIRVAIPATLLSADQAAEIVSVGDVTVRDGEVSGEVMNKSRTLVREVQLQIQYIWLWNDEYHPRKDDPGRTVYYTVEREIQPGQRERFTYKPSPPLPSRTDGVFETRVTVAGFVQVSR